MSSKHTSKQTPLDKQKTENTFSPQTTDGSSLLSESGASTDKQSGDPAHDKYVWREEDDLPPHPIGKDRRRLVHNIVEKKRKDKIKTWINTLGDLLPSYLFLGSEKNTISTLEKTADYLRDLQHKNELLLQDKGSQVQAEVISRLEKQIVDLKKLNARYEVMLKEAGIGFALESGMLWKNKRNKYSGLQNALTGSGKILSSSDTSDTASGPQKDVENINKTAADSTSENIEALTARLQGNKSEVTKKKRVRNRSNLLSSRVKEQSKQSDSSSVLPSGAKPVNQDMLGVAMNAAGMAGHMPISLPGANTIMYSANQIIRPAITSVTNVNQMVMPASMGGTNQVIVPPSGLVPVMNSNLQGLQQSGFVYMQPGTNPAAQTCGSESVTTTPGGGPLQVNQNSLTARNTNDSQTNPDDHMPASGASASHLNMCSHNAAIQTLVSIATSNQGHSSNFSMQQIASQQNTMSLNNVTMVTQTLHGSLPIMSASTNQNALNPSVQSLNSAINVPFIQTGNPVANQNTVVNMMSGQGSFIVQNGQLVFVNDSSTSSVVVSESRQPPLKSAAHISVPAQNPGIMSAQPPGIASGGVTPHLLSSQQGKEGQSGQSQQSEGSSVQPAASTGSSSVATSAGSQPGNSQDSMKDLNVPLNLPVIGQSQAVIQTSQKTSQSQMPLHSNRQQLGSAQQHLNMQMSQTMPHAVTVSPQTGVVTLSNPGQLTGGVVHTNLGSGFIRVNSTPSQPNQLPSALVLPSGQVIPVVTQPSFMCQSGISNTVPVVPTLQSTTDVLTSTSIHAVGGIQAQMSGRVGVLSSSTALTTAKPVSTVPSVMMEGGVAGSNHGNKSATCLTNQAVTSEGASLSNQGSTPNSAMTPGMMSLPLASTPSQTVHHLPQPVHSNLKSSQSVGITDTTMTSVSVAGSSTALSLTSNVTPSTCSTNPNQPMLGNGTILLVDANGVPIGTIPAGQPLPTASAQPPPSNASKKQKKSNQRILMPKPPSCGNHGNGMQVPSINAFPGLQQSGQTSVQSAWNVPVFTSTANTGSSTNSLATLSKICYSSSDSCSLSSSTVVVTTKIEGSVMESIGSMQSCPTTSKTIFEPSVSTATKTSTCTVATDILAKAAESIFSSMSEMGVSTQIGNCCTADDENTLHIDTSIGDVVESYSPVQSGGDLDENLSKSKATADDSSEKTGSSDAAVGRGAESAADVNNSLLGGQDMPHEISDLVIDTGDLNTSANDSVKKDTLISQPNILKQKHTVHHMPQAVTQSQQPVCSTNQVTLHTQPYMERTPISLNCASTQGHTNVANSQLDVNEMAQQNQPRTTTHSDRQTNMALNELNQMPSLSQKSMCHQMSGQKQNSSQIAQESNERLQQTEQMMQQSQPPLLVQSGNDSSFPSQPTDSAHPINNSKAQFEDGKKKASSKRRKSSNLASTCVTMSPQKTNKKKSSKKSSPGTALPPAPLEPLAATCSDDPTTTRPHFLPDTITFTESELSEVLYQVESLGQSLQTEGSQVEGQGITNSLQSQKPIMSQNQMTTENHMMLHSLSGGQDRIHFENEGQTQNQAQGQTQIGPSVLTQPAKDRDMKKSHPRKTKSSQNTSDQPAIKRKKKGNTTNENIQETNAPQTYTSQILIEGFSAALDSRCDISSQNTQQHQEDVVTENSRCRSSQKVLSSENNSEKQSNNSLHMDILLDFDSSVAHGNSIVALETDKKKEPYSSHASMMDRNVSSLSSSVSAMHQAPLASPVLSSTESALTLITGDVSLTSGPRNHAHSSPQKPSYLASSVNVSITSKKLYLQSPPGNDMQMSPPTGQPHNMQVSSGHLLHGLSFTPSSQSSGHLSAKSQSFLHQTVLPSSGNKGQHMQDLPSSRIASLTPSSSMSHHMQESPGGKSIFDSVHRMASTSSGLEQVHNQAVFSPSSSNDVNLSLLSKMASSPGTLSTTMTTASTMPTSDNSKKSRAVKMTPPKLSLDNGRGAMATVTKSTSLMNSSPVLTSLNQNRGICSKTSQSDNVEERLQKLGKTDVPLSSYKQSHNPGLFSHRDQHPVNLSSFKQDKGREVHMVNSNLPPHLNTFAQNTPLMQSRRSHLVAPGDGVTPPYPAPHLSYSAQSLFTCQPKSHSSPPQGSHGSGMVSHGKNGPMNAQRQVTSSPVPYQPQVTSSSAPYQPQVTSSSAPYQPQVTSSSTSYHSQVISSSASYQPQVTSSSAPYQPQVTSIAAPYEHQSSSPAPLQHRPNFYTADNLASPHTDTRSPYTSLHHKDRLLSPSGGSGAGLGMPQMQEGFNFPNFSLSSSSAPTAITAAMVTSSMATTATTNSFTFSLTSATTTTISSSLSSHMSSHPQPHHQFPFFPLHPSLAQHGPAVSSVHRSASSGMPSNSSFNFSRDNQHTSTVPPALSSLTPSSTAITTSRLSQQPGPVLPPSSQNQSLRRGTTQEPLSTFPSQKSHLPSRNQGTYSSFSSNDPPISLTEARVHKDSAPFMHPPKDSQQVTKLTSVNRASKMAGDSRHSMPSEERHRMPGTGPMNELSPPQRENRHNGQPPPVMSEVGDISQKTQQSIAPLFPPPPLPSLTEMKQSAPPCSESRSNLQKRTSSCSQSQTATQRPPPGHVNRHTSPLYNPPSFHSSGSMPMSSPALHHPTPPADQRVAPSGGPAQRNSNFEGSFATPDFPGITSFNMPNFEPPPPPLLQVTRTTAATSQPNSFSTSQSASGNRASSAANQNKPSNKTAKPKSNSKSKKKNSTNNSGNHGNKPCEVDTNLSNSIFESNRSMTPFFPIGSMSPPPATRGLQAEGPTYIPGNLFMNPSRPLSNSSSTQHKGTADMNAPFNGLFQPSRPQSSLALNFQSPHGFAMNHIATPNNHHTTSASMTTPHSNSVSVTPHVPSFSLSNIFPDVNNPAGVQGDSLNISPIKFHHANPMLPPQPGMDHNALQHHHHQSAAIYHNRPHPPPVIHNAMAINSILGHQHHGFEARGMSAGMNGAIGPPFHGHGHTPSFGMPTLNFMHDH